MSEIRANTVSDAAGTGPVTLTGQVAMRAAVNYNQASVLIRESLNISSVTDDSTGVCTFAFSSNFADTNWTLSVGSGNDDGTNQSITYMAGGQTAKTSGGVALRTMIGDGTASGVDRKNVCMHNYGDLA